MLIFVQSKLRVTRLFHAGHESVQIQRHVAVDPQRKKHNEIIIRSGRRVRFARGAILRA